MLYGCAFPPFLGAGNFAGAFHGVKGPSPLLNFFIER